jgi:hypothetical protein
VPTDPSCVLLGENVTCIVVGSTIGRVRQMRRSLAICTNGKKHRVDITGLHTLACGLVIALSSAVYYRAPIFLVFTLRIFLPRARNLAQVGDNRSRMHWPNLD